MSTSAWPMWRGNASVHGLDHFWDRTPEGHSRAQVMITVPSIALRPWFFAFGCNAVRNSYYNMDGARVFLLLHLGPND